MPMEPMEEEGPVEWIEVNPSVSPWSGVLEAMIHQSSNPVADAAREVYCNVCIAYHLPGQHIPMCTQCRRRHRPRTSATGEPRACNRTWCEVCLTSHQGEACARCEGCGVTHPGARCEWCRMCQSYHDGERCRWCSACYGNHDPVEDGPCCACEYCLYRTRNNNGSIRYASGIRPSNGSDHRRAERAINNYSYAPELRFYGRGPRFLGMELEVEVHGNRQRAAQEVKAVVGDYAHMKDDGSIQNGFELVTQPMSYNYFMNRFPWFDLCQTLEQVEAYSTEGTGIHVHVSKPAFRGATHRYKWLTFFYRNRNPISDLARRESHWAAWDNEAPQFHKAVAKGYPDDNLRRADREELQRSVVEFRRRRDASRYVDDSLYLPRYSAVNCNTGKGTYEVRVFGSSTVAQEIQAALGLVDATVAYSAQLTSYDIHHNGGFTWEPFAKWVKGQGSKYKSLRREMEDKACAY